MKVTATIEKTILINLIVTEEVARFIKDVCQNPHSEDESPEITVIREALWNALAGKV